MLARMWVGDGLGELDPVVGTGEHAGDDAGPGPVPGDDVAGGVAGHGDRPDALDVESHQRGEDQIGVRATPDARLGTERQVDEVAPPEHVDDLFPRRT